MGNSGGHAEDNGRGNCGRAAHYTMDGVDPRCRQLLDDAGFTYDPRIGAWFDLEAGRAISFERVAERTPQWLAAWLARK